MEADLPSPERADIDQRRRQLRTVLRFERRKLGANIRRARRTARDLARATQFLTLLTPEDDQAAEASRTAAEASRNAAETAGEHWAELRDEDREATNAISSTLYSGLAESIGGILGTNAAGRAHTRLMLQAQQPETFDARGWSGGDGFGFNIRQGAHGQGWNAGA